MRAIEGYPLTSEDAANAQALYVGPRAMYERAGFEPVRDAASFTVMRKSL
jgi:hypothetical protein